MNATATATTTSLTPADLLAMPDENNYELVDGQLVERNMGFLSSWVAGELLFKIGSYGERLMMDSGVVGWMILF